MVAMDQAASSTGTATPGLNWNVTRMIEDIDRDDETARLATIFNLSDHLPPLNEALPVVRKAFYDQSERVRNRALTASARLVGTTEEHVLVETCEAMLRHDPVDLAALHVLLHFYAGERGRSESHHKARHSLVLHVIENVPDGPHSLAVPMRLSPEEDGEAFVRAKALWLQQVHQHPDNPRVLENASVFFRFIDDTMAGKLLRRCKELDPEIAHWSRELGFLYSFQGNRGQPESRTDWGLMSLAELENAYRSATDPHNRFFALLKIPAVCLDAGEIEKARRYAEELLARASQEESPFTQVWGDREANMVLGWYALYNNDLAEARARLFAARVPVDAYLTSSYCFMDPLMNLLGWMLERGQHEAVLEYLARDQGLVPRFRDRLAKWSSDIEGSLTPDFRDRALLRENLELTKGPP
jgi:hypothetical protein